jgi:hypothetical protein
LDGSRNQNKWVSLTFSPFYLRGREILLDVRSAKSGDLGGFSEYTHLYAKIHFICTTRYDPMPFMRLVNRSLLVNPEPGIEAHAPGHNERIMQEISAIQS